MFVYVRLHVFFFVNDITIMYYLQFFKQINVFKQKFFEIYKMKNIDEIEWFFNIRIIRNKKQQKTFLCQNNYIDKFINKFNINIIKTKLKLFLINYIFIMKNEKTIILQKIYAY